jgi:hypothetical protein
MRIFWSVFFWLAAAYNIAVGIPLVLSPELILQPGTETPVPGPADMFVPLSGVLIAGFGIVYALVALQPVRMKPVVWAGVFGKGGVLALSLPPFFRGEVGLDAVALSLGDLAFTIGFLVFLFTFRPKPKSD